MSTAVLFLSGPRDGQSLILEHAPARLDVALYERVMESVVGGVDGQVVPSVRKFEYVRFGIAGRVLYVPSDWVRFSDTYERVITALTRGYVGRA